MPDHMTLAEETARRFILAGVTPDHPEIRLAREWNTAAHQRREVTMTPSYRPGRIRHGSGTPDPE